MDTINKSSVVLNKEKVLNIINSNENVNEKKLKELQLKNKDNNINISLIALNKLGKIGFNEKNLGTLFLSNIIEFLYYEKEYFDGSDYFDLSLPNNIHYKFLEEKYGLDNVDLYRGFIAREIGISKCETKNINEIVYSVISMVTKELNSKKKITKKLK